ncbi:MAG: Coenzyme F420 hydrogenase/dehydrogenase, beta subunit C-terminal domain [Ruminococcus sp.]|nr:Coenzyme F420 hydrogenase/dehydrogenase, beta subunit C-terminal domain [Ruminococcus sp.]
MINLFSSKDRCCGCAACASVCPKNAIIMKNDASGFAYPEVNSDLCVDCGMCKKVCPFGCDKAEAEKYESNVYAVLNKDEKIRRKSSSGGFFSTLANEIVEKKGVVYGAVFDDDFKVQHIRGTDVEKIALMRGSKYVQSDMTGVFPQIKMDLNDGKKVLFTGTGCQVAGLKKYLGKDFENLITVDIVCHGVPSQKHFDGYKAMLEKKYGSELKSFSFRTKKLKGEIQDIEAVFKNGKCYSEYPDADDFRCMFSKNYTLRPSCFVCPYATDRRVGDITIGDFWGIEKTMPEFKNPLGNSLAVVSTDKGKKLFESVKNQIEIRKSSMENALQPSLVKPATKPDNYDEFTADFEACGFEYVSKKYKLVPTMKKIKRKIKKLL